MNESLFKIPEKKKIRVIIDTDAACECDDQIAIAHALMSEKAEVRSILAEHFAAEGSMAASHREIARVCELMNVSANLAVTGAAHAMCDEQMPVPSNASDALVKEALRADGRPLFVLCQGALTNVASAILTNPEICRRMLLVIVGGTDYPRGGYEFNTMNDMHAFNAVMNSAAPVWLVPEEVYSTMQVSFSEMMEKIYPCGEIGEYLAINTFATVQKMMDQVPDFSETAPYDYAVGFPNGESWSLGDSVAIGLLLSHNSGTYRSVAAPNVHADGSYSFRENAKQIRWYTSINQRLILEDFFAKLKRRYGGA